ncbi:MAG: hypothetical protein JXA44_13740 [Methanospirillaceae archaeon]|nr:hypothetical protein [Methanospirillaceae archaeon]
MSALSHDTDCFIPGCEDGLSGFHAGYSMAGGRVISLDRLYPYTVEEICTGIREIRPYYQTGVTKP